MDIKKEIKKPECLLEEHLEYLDDLRESGDINMWGANAYLLDEYPDLSKVEGSEILSYWMDTFSERHKIGDDKE